MKRALIAALTLLISAAAPAQTPADKQASVEAKRHFERGLAHFNLQEYPAAIAEFEEGYRLRPSPVFLYNLGQASRLGDNLERALYFYRTYLRVDPGAPNREEVERRIAELERLQAARSAMVKPPNGPIAPDDKSATDSERTPGATGAAAATPAPATVAPASTAVTPAPATIAPAIATAAAPTAAMVTSASDAPARPLTRRPWFWAALGGGVAVMAAGIAVGVTLGGRSTNPMPTYGVANGN